MSHPCAPERSRVPIVVVAAAALAFVGTTAVGARAAAAGTLCPAGVGAGAGSSALGAIDGEVRLDWIDRHLSLTAHRARVWTWGWGIGIGVATLANLAPLPFVAKSDRIDWYTGAATTIVGIVPLLIAPLDVIEDADALHARVGARPYGLVLSGAGATARDVCDLLSDAETRLARDAKNQADGQRWWLHVGNVALNTGVGLFLALGFHHWLAGGFNAIFGSAIGEAIILTQPTGSIADLRRYRDGALDAP